MLLSQLFSYIQGEENTIPDMEQKTSDSMMDNNHRTLQNSNAMVQTEDNVRYTYTIDQGNNGVSSQLGGWSATPYGAEEPSLVEPSSGGGSGLSTWSVALMLSAFVALSVGCTIYSFCKQSQSQSRPQASSPQQSSTTEAGLSRKERKSRLLAYFERSGHQMEVKAENLLTMNSEDKGDIENGIMGVPADQELGSIDGIREDGNGSTILLVTKKGPTANGAQNTQMEGAGSSGGSSTPMEPMDASCDSSPSSHDVMDTAWNQSSSSSLSCNQEMDEERCQRQQQVTDACAICLEPYRVGETVVWAETCPHVYHKYCFVEYLMSHRGKGTPCPSCRQSYCDETVFCPSADETKEGESSSSSNSVATGGDLVEDVGLVPVLSDQEGNASTLRVDDEAPDTGT